jgi:hypothetical protein
VPWNPRRTVLARNPASAIDKMAASCCTGRVSQALADHAR